MDAEKITHFIGTIKEYYIAHKRKFPWRETENPYAIFISEIMLQQTQTLRVLPKYESFIARFPTFDSLAQSTVHDVLAEWKGLGYNRRALFLQKAAQIIVADYKGKLPVTEKELQQLPGIGKATAASILAFVYNMPTVFIETNIRTVYLHFFFSDQNTVSDSQILLLIEKTLDNKNPREWYYALMDYGVMLKKNDNNATAKKSKHYTKQSPFSGSTRQLRGKILSVLLEKKEVLEEELKKMIGNDDRFEKIIHDLLKEGFVEQKEKIVFLKSQ